MWVLGWSYFSTALTNEMRPHVPEQAPGGCVLGSSLLLSKPFCDCLFDLQGFGLCLTVVCMRLPLSAKL